MKLVEVVSWTSTAAIILDYEKLFALDDKTRGLIRDSKKLSAKQRDKIIPVIKEIAISYAVQEASVEEIDDLNIIGATFRYEQVPCKFS